MAKKPVALDGLLNMESRPADTGIPQRGSVVEQDGSGQGGAKPVSGRRQGERRLTLALDGEAYRRLRMHAVETDRTHQDILEAALAEYLDRAST